MFFWVDALSYRNMYIGNAKNVPKICIFDEQGETDENVVL